MRIAAGIVTFNPNIERLKENIEAVIKQVDELIIVDNFSDSGTIQCINNIFHGKIIANSKNYGIAYALNQFLSYADENDYEYVICLDQDSIVPKNIVSEYSNVLKKLNFDVKIGILSPLVFDINGGYNSKFDSNLSYEYVDKVINSATLVSVRAWKHVNGFDEIMFIDDVDFDFCERLLKKNYKIIRVNSVVLKHEIGHITNYKILFWNIKIQNHPANRKYYIVRNIIYRARKTQKINILFIAIFRVLKQIMLVVLFEQDKINKINMMKKGFKDGFKVKLSDKWSL